MPERRKQNWVPQAPPPPHWVVAFAEFCEENPRVVGQLVRLIAKQPDSTFWQSLYDHLLRTAYLSPRQRECIAKEYPEFTPLPIGSKWRDTRTDFLGIIVEDHPNHDDVIVVRAETGDGRATMNRTAFLAWWVIVDGG